MYMFCSVCLDNIKRKIKKKWTELPFPLLPLSPSGQYWRSVNALAHTVDMSYLQAQRRDSASDAVSALASLTMGVHSNSR